MPTMLKTKLNSLPKISGENYLSPEFLRGEKEHLWPKVWQVACREEEIPKVGDYVTYDVADETIVVLRARNGIRAFHNVCPHRGRKIADGCGHAPALRCRYHGWTFDLEGRNTVVQDRQDWKGALDDERLDLFPVRTGTWAGFVWINMDSVGETLEEYLETLPEFLDPYELEQMRYRWYLELHLPCNWKVALEAFMEGYHVAGTHPQLLPVQGEDYTQSYAHGKHSHFGYWEPSPGAGPRAMGGPSPRLKDQVPRDLRPGVVEFFRQMEEDFGAIFTDRDFEASKRVLKEVPENVEPFVPFGAAVEFGREAANADGAGYPPKLDYAHMMKAGTDWHIFPNCVTLPWFDGAVWYRARPNGNDPDSCIFNIWSLKRFGPGKEPKLERRVIKNIEGLSFGLIVDQDIANMNAVQQGMKSRAFRYARPNPVQEVELTNFHQTLERYVLGQTRPDIG